MRTRLWLVFLTVMLAAAGAFWTGRATAPPPGPTDRGYAAGLRDGRAEQATLGRAAADKAVFDSGYAAGAADAFAGFDGGWDLRAPYVIVLAPGGAGITYRIAERTRLEPGADYHLCPDGHTLCRT